MTNAPISTPQVQETTPVDTVVNESTSYIQAKKPTTQDEEVMRKGRSLSELLLLMDAYSPVLPDEVIDYYLARAGLELNGGEGDVRIKRLLGLATQKFVSGKV